MNISDRTFELVIEHLHAVNYNGPVCLSCDDTKLLSTLRLYWDGEKMAHFLVGSVGGPIEVPNPDDIKCIMSDPTIVKATKVQACLNWFTVPLLNNNLHIGSAVVLANSSTEGCTYNCSCHADTK